MPKKKAAVKKAPAAKKAANKAALKKATPEKPAGVTKNRVTSKASSSVKKPTKASATPKPAKPKPTREIFGDIRKSQSQLPYNPDTDVSGPLRRMGEEEHRERAAEIFRLYGGAAVETCGSVNDDGWRYSDGTLESRYGLCDLNHYADSWLWIHRVGKMRRVMEALVVKDQTERQNAFFSVGCQNSMYPPHLYTESMEEQKKRQDARDLAAYYKKHPEEGNRVPRKKSVSASTMKKMPSSKTSATKA